MNNIIKHTNGMSIAELKELLIKLENALTIRRKMLTNAIKNLDGFAVNACRIGIRDNENKIAYIREKLANA